MYKACFGGVVYGFYTPEINMYAGYENVYWILWFTIFMEFTNLDDGCWRSGNLKCLALWMLKIVFYTDSGFNAIHWHNQKYIGIFTKLFLHKDSINEHYLSYNLTITNTDITKWMLIYENQHNDTYTYAIYAYKQCKQNTSQTRYGLKKINTTILIRFNIYDDRNNTTITKQLYT